MAEHNEIGRIGETITKEFLMKQGFHVLDSNYRIKYGEIDIIAKKDSILHFVEVKSIKVRDLHDVSNLVIKPEDNLTESKWQKIIITIENYLQHKKISRETRYQVDLACVYINTESREGRVRLLQNIHEE